MLPRLVIAGRYRDAVGPAVEAARAVLESVKQAALDEIKLTFGIKVSGAANWLVGEHGHCGRS